MALTIAEFFGFSPTDPAASKFASAKRCPFVPRTDPRDPDEFGKCIKPKHGACSLTQASRGSPVIACPNRLYAGDYKVLQDVAGIAFGRGTRLVRKAEVDTLKASGGLTGGEVVVFGKNWGSELSIPQNKSEDVDAAGGFFIDYILARLDEEGSITDFTAVEIQTIDTTGSYKDQADVMFKRHHSEPASDDALDIDDKAGLEGRNYRPGDDLLDEDGYINDDGNPVTSSKAGFNWANVSKRIIPQLIYKGYVLRREKLCYKGLFFVCPSAVLKRVKARLGTKLLDYPIAAGTITFLAYELGEPDSFAGTHRQLLQVEGETLTTTVEQIAYAFVSPVNLPEMGVYEKAIDAALAKGRRKRKL